MMHRDNPTPPEPRGRREAEGSRARISLGLAGLLVVVALALVLARGAAERGRVERAPPSPGPEEESARPARDPSDGLLAASDCDRGAADASEEPTSLATDRAQPPFEPVLRVLDRDDRPIPGARVELALPDGPRDLATDERGAVALSGLIDASGGVARLHAGRAEAPGFRPREFSLATPTAGVPAEQTVVLDRSTRVFGRVFDARGAPAGGALVTVAERAWSASAACDGPEGLGGWSAETDARGHYLFEDLPAGPALYWWVLSPDGEQAADDAGEPLEAGSVQRDWTLASAPAIAGRLRDEEGRALADRELRLRPDPTRTAAFEARARTDVNGEFRFDRVVIDGAERPLSWGAYELSLPDDAAEALLAGAVAIEVAPGASETRVDVTAGPTPREDGS